MSYIQQDLHTAFYGRNTFGVFQALTVPETTFIGLAKIKKAGLKVLEHPF